MAQNPQFVDRPRGLKTFAMISVLQFHFRGSTVRLACGHEIECEPRFARWQAGYKICEACRGDVDE